MRHGVSGNGDAGLKREALLRGFRPLAVIPTAAELAALFEERDGLSQRAK